MREPLFLRRDYGLYMYELSMDGSIGTVTNSGSVTSVKEVDAVSIRTGILLHSSIPVPLTETIEFRWILKILSFSQVAQLNGDVEAAKIMSVTGNAELTGNIAGVQPDYSNYNGVKYVNYSEADYNAFTCRC